MLIGVCLVQTQPQRCATFAEVICAHRWLTSLDLQGGSATCARASSRAHARWLRTPASTPRSSRSTATNVRAASPVATGSRRTRASSTLARPQRQVAARAMSSSRPMRMHECSHRGCWVCRQLLGLCVMFGCERSMEGEVALAMVREFLSRRVCAGQHACVH